MMTQEEYLDIPGLKRQGWTLQQIAEEVGYHPATVREWIRRGGPPQKRQIDPANLVINEHWAQEIAMLLKANPNLLATSVERLLRAKGFTGSYPTLARYLCGVRGSRRGRQVEVSVPIETAPGEEFQFDWSDCCDFARLWGWEQLHCFGAILCYCRRRHWWFTDSIDRHHTFEGLVRFSRTPAESPESDAPTGWGAWVAPTAGCFAGSLSRWSSPPTTAFPSRRARPATPSARARWSVPFGR